MQVFGIGTHIVECLRIAQMIERHGEYFITRVYTEHEIRHCASRKWATQHYASHWAAKEAVLRALGVEWQRGIKFRDIEIRNNDAGKPVVAFRAGARDLIEELGIGRMLISLSHCRTHATAQAMAFAGDLDPWSED